ncbi:PHP domain-containing protein [Williamsia sterculiae]|uniref:Putative hydrolase n=1 Tax=Williamsia sterculiae TaxID=1344003 RepID=A0A1N7CH69_9NOCA|nr:PHP domain-containing protein [Williamsia sterculiae]SIR62817.1 putative hydrolase [Williamsia sterculiae]
MRSVPSLVAPVSPADALRRIAFLLERDRAGTYRIEAFRRALRVVTELGPDEVARRVRAGSLTDVKGIGRSTAGVIDAAIDGRLPPYLVELQEHAAVLDGSGTPLYGHLRGDLHTHSNWSDGGSPITEMVLAAKELGQEWLALTDHSPRLTVANGLSAERLREQIDVVATLNTDTDDEFWMLTGIEVDILSDGSLDQEPELLDRVDIVTASVHSELKMEAAAMTRRMVAAVTGRRVHVLGHCTGRLVTGGRGSRGQSRFDAEAVFTACAANDTAVEINSRPERVDPPDELISLAADLGCLFAIDSDAHAPGQLDFKALGCERAQRLGIDPDRIVTTWPLARLQRWSALGR